jgi:uncharacterized membrane protein YeaQ/YmgE (transglycosylase-associated protein family)
VSLVLKTEVFFAREEGCKGCMSVLAWMVFGLIAGLVTSNILSRSGQGLLLDLVLGVLGAVVGGFLFTAIGATGITGFNMYSMLVAIVGAILVLWVYHAFSGRSL